MTGNASASASAMEADGARDRRLDQARARVFEAALRVNVVLGPMNAWYHLRLRDIAPATALRAISCNGTRRQSDEEAMREALQQKHTHWQSECETMLDVRHGENRRRRDTITAQVVDRAVELSKQDARPEAEELLELYGVAASAIQRVMLEPDRRRAIRWY
ncbi:hypothetical protein [Massilia sp. METH4]|uniref:hypothetical protein n=1 Tax=Massilia sp. METH4 TaxID=3123041 RepID=UPI0030CFD4A2